MKLTIISIIQVYQYIASIKKRGYSESSQMKVLSFLEKYYDVSICRRTLCYHLRRLEDDNFIKRIRRHKRGPDGKILFHTSVTVIKKRALSFLSKIAYWFKKVGWRLRTPSNEVKAFNYKEWHERSVVSYRQHVFNSS